mmetsp:Transcript_17544/g.28815  ORF Transcript_17544/g.28815 Transcript_17544/m.28815 type:complete len:321 (-) Transcript_17544:313-1275(-)
MESTKEICFPTTTTLLASNDKIPSGLPGISDRSFISVLFAFTLSNAGTVLFLTVLPGFTTLSDVALCLSIIVVVVVIGRPGAFGTMEGLSLRSPTTLFTLLLSLGGCRSFVSLLAIEPLTEEDCLFTTSSDGGAFFFSFGLPGAFGTALSLVSTVSLGGRSFLLEVIELFTDRSFVLSIFFSSDPTEGLNTRSFASMSVRSTAFRSMSGLPGVLGAGRSFDSSPLSLLSTAGLFFVPDDVSTKALVSLFVELNADAPKIFDAVCVSFFFSTRAFPSCFGVFTSVLFLSFLSSSLALSFGKSTTLFDSVGIDGLSEDFTSC